MKIAIFRPSGTPVPRRPARLRALALAAAAALTLGACTSEPARKVVNLVRPYKPEIQQGNVITRDMVDQLRPGMTRDQVRFMLGTPMLRDIFHEDRWDYPYLLTRSSGETQVRKLVVLFADGRVQKFDSDTMPAEPLADTLIFEGRSEMPELRTKPPGAKEDR
jgi:outer membrane protein assembly factor BamE